MLMRPNKAETAVHGCHCPGDMAVRMRKALARPWVGLRVCHLLYLIVIQKQAHYMMWLICFINIHRMFQFPSVNRISDLKVSR